MALFRFFWSRFRSAAGDDLDPDIYIGRGNQRLNDGDISLAVEDPSKAIDFLPTHGIALALAAIASTRAADRQLQKKIIKRYRSASKQLLFDLGEVGKWYSRPPESDAPTLQMEENRTAFNAFVKMLGPVLEGDRERLYWLGEGLHTAQLADASVEVLTRYCRKYPGHQDAEAMLINSVVLTCDFTVSENFWKEQHARLARELASGDPISIDPFNLKLTDIDIELFSRVCRRRSLDFLPADGATVKRKTSVPAPGGRIKLGLVLPYSWFASMNTTLAGLLPEFDRSRFEIYGYAMNTAPNPDEFEIKYRQLYDQFVALDGLDPKAVATRIAADGIDIALEFKCRTVQLLCLSWRIGPRRSRSISSDGPPLLKPPISTI